MARPFAIIWGTPGVAELSAARIDDLPQASLEVVESLACLGTRAELHVLHIATGERASVAEPLLPALDGGLLVVEPGAHEALPASVTTASTRSC